MCIDLAVWKNDSLFEAMMKHPRFSPCILIAPEMQIKDLEERKRYMKSLADYCKRKGFPHFSLCDETGDTQGRTIPEDYDILIYSKPYEGAVPPALDFPQYLDRLFIRIPYGLRASSNKRYFQLKYPMLSWIDFFENKHMLELDRGLKKHNRFNGMVTGLPVTDKLFSPPGENPWKPQQGEVKRIIWAPHWTISTAKSIAVRRSNFERLAVPMLNLARETATKIQWAFKPHPLLKYSLYKHPDWGITKTEEYFSAWANGISTQLEVGEYYDLFKYSDGMIHDSDSFTLEYHTTGKPVMFIVSDAKNLFRDRNIQCAEGLKAHYIGKEMVDIRNFVNDVIIQKHDFKSEDRKKIVEKYITPPYHRCAAENIIHAILDSEL